MTTCHVKDDIQGRQRATSRTTYNNNNNNNNVLLQPRHTMAACHVNEAHNDDDNGPDDAFASSGPLGKLFIYFFINLILNLYYRLLQVLLTMHDDDLPCQGRRHAMSRTTYKDDDVLHQGRHTTAACHVNEAHNDDDDGPDDAFASSGP